MRDATSVAPDGASGFSVSASSRRVLSTSSASSSPARGASRSAPATDGGGGVLSKTRGPSRLEAVVPGAANRDVRAGARPDADESFDQRCAAASCASVLFFFCVAAARFSAAAFVAAAFLAFFSAFLASARLRFLSAAASLAFLSSARRRSLAASAALSSWFDGGRPPRCDGAGVVVSVAKAEPSSETLTRGPSFFCE